MAAHTGEHPSDGVVLPMLTPRTYFQSVPRRYEETKLAINQDFTHRKIIDLGKQLHRETLDRCHVEKLEAVRIAEEAVKVEAERIKNETVTQALKKAQHDHEKGVKKLNKQHEKTLLEQAMKIQGDMQVGMNKALEKAEKEAAKRVQQAVQETEKRLNEYYGEKLRETREEERAAAAAEAERVARENQQKFDAAMKAAEEDKERAVADQKAVCQREKEFAVAHAHSVEQVQCAKKIADLRHSYEDKTEEVKQYVIALKEILDTTQRNLDAETTMAGNLVDELLETRAEFQKFINRTKPFCPGESDYLIPPVRSTDVTKYIEKKAEQE